MKLTQADKELLTKWGHGDDDFPQIERAFAKRYSPSAVSGKRISIDIGHGKTLDVEFFQPNLEGSLEVSLSVIDGAGSYQDFVMLRADQAGKNMEVLLWKDPENEDYTDLIEIPFGEYTQK